MYDTYMALAREYGLVTAVLFVKAENNLLTMADVQVARDISPVEEDSTVIRVLAGAIEPVDLPFLMKEVMKAAEFDLKGVEDEPIIPRP